MKKVAYVIGRFQPFHIGHHALIQKAMAIADQIVVIIGDTGCARTFRDPWTVEERIEMILGEFDHNERIQCVGVEDMPYNDDAWKGNVMELVAEFRDGGKEYLVGYKKDASSFYLDMFPEWEFAPIPLNVLIDATAIREDMCAAWPAICIPSVGPATKQVIMRTVQGKRAIGLVNEYRAIQNHISDWTCPAVGKYGGPFSVAVDTLLYSSTHVLLIRRGGDVGAGTLALPGGFVDPSERLIDAALRELREETGIEIPRVRFPSNPVGLLTAFDHPQRSMRGRIVTNVLPITVNDHRDLQPVAADDAAAAEWFPIADLPRLKREFFSDHFHIVRHFIKD